MEPEALKEKAVSLKVDAVPLIPPVPTLSPAPVVDIALSKKGFYASRGKRVAGVIVASSMIVALSPILLATFLLVALDQKSLRLTIFKQDRVGKERKIFSIYKFRSMASNAEVNGPQFSNGKLDVRITSVGRFIRKFRLDELPQLFNVLKGEMALIGPRPEREVFHDRIVKKIPAFRRRLDVRPGITGLAQVSNGYVGSDLEGHKAKLDADLYYIRNLTFSMDLKIAFKTVGCVLRGEGM